MTEINSAKKIIKRIRHLKNKFRSRFDVINSAIKKNRDINIIALKMSLKTTRYSLCERKKETIRITARKIDK
ncbi:MAG: hypothetical protein NT144_13300 [Bacteroidia bacterium]|nr:hypothetical protein [Bacteroidia bacterium]